VIGGVQSRRGYQNTPNEKMLSAKVPIKYALLLDFIIQVK